MGYAKKHDQLFVKAINILNHQLMEVCQVKLSRFTPLRHFCNIRTQGQGAVEGRSRGLRKVGAGG